MSGSFQLVEEIVADSVDGTFYPGPHFDPATVKPVALLMQRRVLRLYFHDDSRAMG